MNSIMHRFLLLTILGLVTLTTSAAISFSARVPRHVNEGNKFNVTFVLENAQGADFQPPADPEGTTRLFGPSISHSTSISIVNGQRTDASSVEYTMIYKANRAGRITIGSASVMADGRKMTTKPVTIEVHPGNGQQGGGQQPQPQRTPPPVQYDDPMTQSAERAVSGKDIFVRIEMSRPRVYEQQAVVCTIKLYTKYQVSEFIPTLQPSFDGFLIEDINMQPSLNNVETYNGQRYMVALLKKCILYPQQSGKLTITSGNYDVGVVQYEQYRTPFGVMQQPVEKKLQVKSNTATVNILPLPEPRPTSFTGAVGKFSVTTDLKPQQLKTFSAATLTCSLSGTGNIKYIKAPEIDFPDQFDAYEPKTDIKVNAGGADMSGRLDIEYVFVPQYVGEFDIPDTPFTYFDPDAQQYRTITIPGRHLSVAKGEGAPSTEARQRNADIRHIVTSPTALAHEHPDAIGSSFYWIAYLVPAVLVLALLIAYRKRLSLMADRSQWLNRRAGKMASKRLKRAAQLVDNENNEAFYNELLSALWGYLGDKLSIPVSSLNRDNIIAELQNFGVDEPLQQRTVALLDECEFAQYAAATASGDKQSLLDRARQLIVDLQRVGKRRQATSQTLNLLILLLASTASLTASAADTAIDSLWNKANKAYVHEAYNEAINDYRLLERQYGSSSALYYNMANTYYRLKDNGRAILYYERALRLDPSNDDARFNLQFVRERAQIDENDGLSFFTRQIDNVVNRFSSNTWAWLAVVAFLLMLVSLLGYLLMDNLTWRKMGFFAALAMLALTLVALGCAWHIHHRNVTHSQAIIVAEGAQLSTVPRDPKDKTEVVDHLPVGTKVSVLDSVANEKVIWLDVRTVDRQRAWIKRSDVEPI